MKRIWVILNRRHGRGKYWMAYAPACRTEREAMREAELLAKDNPQMDYAIHSYVREEPSR